MPDASASADSLPPPWEVVPPPGYYTSIVREDVLWCLLTMDSTDKERLSVAIAALVVDRLGRCMGVLNG
jgi:hypothetical protein